MTQAWTNMIACRSKRWINSPSDLAGARNAWLTPAPVPRIPAHPTPATETEPGQKHSRSRSTGHVKTSTQLPDEVTAPDWRALRVALNDRAAIYAEEFPASLAALGPHAVEWFTHDEAQGLLYTFAGAWPVLGRDASDPSTRFVYLTVSDLVYRFRAIELAPGAIIVDDIGSL